MSNRDILGILSFLIVGYLFGFLNKDNLIFGIIILLLPFILLLWTFHKKMGLFRDKQDKNLLVYFIVFLIAGFFLGKWNIVKVPPQYNIFMFFALCFFIFMYLAFSESHKQWKLKKNKKLYNHPIFIIILIILITLLIIFFSL